MALPKVNQVEYTAELPLSKIEVGYRPFTVKEQKIFLIAMEDGTARVVSKALKDVLPMRTWMLGKSQAQT